MKTALIPLLATALTLLSGCASQPIVAIPKPSPDAQAEVTVFRESSFIAGGVSLAVGAGTVAFASIGNSEFVTAFLPVGEQEIFVQARTAEPTKVRLTLRHGSRTCLRTSSSPSTLAKVVIPITLIASGYHFYLDEVPCPTSEEFSKYKQIPVSYASN